MTPASAPPSLGEALDPRRWKTLVVLCLGLSIIMVANGSLNVALPQLADDLGASTSALQWMVDAYALVFAGMLFVAGSLGDRFGRKGALQGGLLLFLLGTGFAVVADSAGQVIAARATMGLAAAFVMPSTLSILTTTFPAHERPRAIALWAGIAAGGAALGPPTSGLLLEHFWWGSVFLVNVPLVAAALIAGWFLVPSSRDPEQRPLDVPGAALSVAGVGLLVYAIIEAPSHGWMSGETLLAFGGAAIALAVFAARELTTRHPMLDLRLFADRRISVASGGISFAFFAMFGTFFLLTQYLQLVLGYSPFHAGLAVLPMSLTMTLAAPRIPKLVARFGVGRVAPCGMALLAVALVGLSRLDAGSSLWQLYLVIIPLPLGMSATTIPLTTTIMQSVPLGQAGVASAMNDTTRELGGALGVAVLGSLVTTRYGTDVGPALSSLPTAAHHAASTGLAGALGVADGLPGTAGDVLAAAARKAFVEGLHLAALVAAGVAALGAMAAAALLPRRIAAAHPTTEAEIEVEAEAGGELVAVVGAE